MGAAYFYHLTRSPLQATLATLLTKSRAAGWRVVVRGRSESLLEKLDNQLWLHPQDGFLPHGRAGGDHDGEQPILLTSGAEIPNSAACLMALEGAEVAPKEVMELERVCILFDGHSPDALARARDQWRALSGAGVAAKYWSEEDGPWQMKAETG